MGRGWLVCVLQWGGDGGAGGGVGIFPLTNYNGDKAKNKELIVNSDIVNKIPFMAH